MLDIRDHGGAYGGNNGLKSDPNKEMFLSVTPYGREVYTSTTNNPTLAANDKYVAYGRNHINVKEIMVIDRSNRNVILDFTIPGSYSPYTTSEQLRGAFAGDCLYFTVAYSSSYDVYAINVKTGFSSLKSIPGASSAGRFENFLCCSDGYVYATSYSRLMKLDNAGNLVYLTSFSYGGGGGNRVFGLFNNELIIGMNSGGAIGRFNPSTGAIINSHVVGPSNSTPTHFCQAGGKYFIKSGNLLSRLSFDFLTNDLTLGSTRSVYCLDDNTLLIFMSDNGTYPAGASTYSPSFVIKRQSVTGIDLTSHICNEKKGSYFEVVSYGVSQYDVAVEESVVRVYYK